MKEPDRAAADGLRQGLPHAPCTSLTTFVKDRPGHDRRYAIDFSKIQTELGWKPSISFNEAIRQTVAWFLDNTAWVANIAGCGYRRTRIGVPDTTSCRKADHIKNTVSDHADRRRLAICSGKPRFDSPRHVGTPTIPDRETLHARLDQMLDARRFTNDGPFVKEFETQLGRLNGDVEVVAVCNATVGMQLLLKALDLKGEAIMPSFTFIATAHACLWEGLEPVFVDVERDTHTIDPECVARQVTDSTAAIIGVHLWGRMCRVRELEAIARDRRVPLVFDAAHALGCTYEGVPMGLLGTASVVSFHGTKFVQSLEGGAIFTRDRELAARLRLLRNFGFQGFDNVVALGTNAKMNEVCAAMGLGSLESLDKLIATNRANRTAYRQAIERLPGLSLYEFDEQESNNFQYLIVEVDQQACPFTRDELVTILQAENVIARRYFTPGCHRSMPYRVRPRRGSDRLTVTEQLCDSLVALPTGAGVTAADIREIGTILLDAYDNAAEVRCRIAAHSPRKAA